MPYTTIDIEKLKRAKHEALDRDMTLKELVNRAIEEYLERHSQSSGSGEK